ncbi:MAG: DUF4062 domain-containing protein [Candidatus Omnitrophica bacterium]|nr:DUF4062 domain-containing protein [Candidatus Omnitrophota bacterium]
MRYKIFVSSVQKELKVERRAIKEFISGDALLSEYFDVFLFEDGCAKSKPAECVFFGEVKNCDVFIGIIDQQYGSVGKNGKSSTEEEYQLARKLDKTVFIYIKGDNGSNDKKRDIMVQRLIKVMGDASKGVVRKRFNSLDELNRLVYSSLIDFLKEQGVVGRGAFDERICRDAKLSDIDEEKVRWFLGAAKASRKYPLKQDTTVKNVFVHLDLMKEGKLTNAAVLLFGKNPHKFFIQAEIKCLQFFGSEVKKPFANYQVYSGNLFEQIDKARAFVLDAIKFPVIQKAGSARFERPYELPEFAIQEAIVNAVAHRNYNNTSGVQVMVFADRVEVWNAGSLPKELTIEDLKKPHTSFPANPYLAHVLYLADYAQRAGSGTIEMMEQCKAQNVSEPEFILIRNKEFRSILPRDILTESVVAGLGLNERQLKAIKYVKEKGSITNALYREICATSDRTATRDLSYLVSLKVFEQRGITGKGTEYFLSRHKSKDSLVSRVTVRKEKSA